MQARRTDFLEKKASFSEAYARTDVPKSIKYALESMKEIDPDYTRISYEECDRVKNHITSVLTENSISFSYEYQGSVPTKTHIKIYSDIDLLVINEEFISLKSPLQVKSAYRGEPVQELITMRQSILGKLKTAFPEASVDNSGSKAVRIKGGSLRREIDVVVANWLETAEYQNTGFTYLRGVRILDNKIKTRLDNFPFLHNYELERKDCSVNGALRKIIRFLKTLKVDSEGSITISSYDITALAYNMSFEPLTMRQGGELGLIPLFSAFLTKVLSNTLYAQTMQVPNKTRKVLCAEGVTLSQIRAMKSDVDEIISDISNEQALSGQVIAEATYDY